MSKPTGGPAFPSKMLFSDGTVNDQFFGMTLRDYFAAKAMQGMLAHTSSHGTVYGLEKLPSDAYRIADAMLAERVE